MAEGLSVRKLLKIEGAECTICENGEEILKAFEQSAPGDYDMILMDVQMPVMNGYEATKAIRRSSHELAKKIPIIAMTANAFSEDIQHSLAAGMNAHVSKPVEMRVLEKMIRSIKSGGGGPKRRPLNNIQVEHPRDLARDSGQRKLTHSLQNHCASSRSVYLSRRLDSH